MSRAYTQRKGAKDAKVAKKSEKNRPLGLHPRTMDARLIIAGIGGVRMSRDIFIPLYSFANFASFAPLR